MITTIHDDNANYGDDVDDDDDDDDITSRQSVQYNGVPLKIVVGLCRDFRHYTNIGEISVKLNISEIIHDRNICHILVKLDICEIIHHRNIAMHT